MEADAVVGSSTEEGQRRWGKRWRQGNWRNNDTGSSKNEVKQKLRTVNSAFSNRALKAIHQLRAVAHVIDMHQLTKDPAAYDESYVSTASSPKRSLSAAELIRYLDYCSELLSLTGKLAALYIQRFDDEIALSAANDIENLTTQLSRKIWQKAMIALDTRGD